MKFIYFMILSLLYFSILKQPIKIENSYKVEFVYDNDIIKTIDKELIYNKIKNFMQYRHKSEITAIWTDCIYLASKKWKLDYTLLISVIKHESSFNNKAISSVGAKGSMQVMWSVWGDKLIENNICEVESDLYDINKGIDAGCFVLKHYIEKYGDVEIGLQRYFGVCSYSSIYSSKILNNM